MLKINFKKEVIKKIEEIVSNCPVEFTGEEIFNNDEARCFMNNLLNIDMIKGVGYPDKVTFTKANKRHAEVTCRLEFHKREINAGLDHWAGGMKVSESKWIDIYEIDFFVYLHDAIKITRIEYLDE